MFIEPRATQRRTPAECYVPTAQDHITLDGVSRRRRPGSINIQLLTALRTAATLNGHLSRIPDKTENVPICFEGDQSYSQHGVRNSLVL